MVEHGKEILSMRITRFIKEQFHFILLLIIVCASDYGYAQVSKPFALVELFTSEGCNTCPPAEKLFSSMKAEAEKNGKNIFFLEYHVDYWNKLGWKDPYSSFQYTNRQKNYTSVLNEESLYTPMMIVNGTNSFTGSDQQKANTSVHEALSTIPEIGLKTKIDSTASDTLYLHYEATKADKNFLIRAAITEDGVVSAVTAGENSGRTLAHEAVVRIFFSSEISKLSGQLKIPLKKFMPGKKCDIISFIQHKQSMKVLAVASASF
jgi:hypothetical protein